jgi:hypothetical protein
MPLTRKRFHEQVYFYTLMLIPVCLLFSVFFTSFLMLFLVLNWLVEMRFREKWTKFAKNRALQVFLLLFGLHALGLLWSSDLAYGLNDLKIKLPLLSMPVIIATSHSLTAKQVRWILLSYSLAVFVATLASLFKLMGWLPGEVNNFRDLSLFMSHIRFSLMIVLALLISGYFVFKRRPCISLPERIFYMLALLWFPVCLALLKSLTGLIIAFILLFLILMRLVLKIRARAVRFMVVVPVIMIPLFIWLYLSHAVERFYDADPSVLDDLDSHTVEGNPYLNMPQKAELENANYVWVHICDKELQREWNRVSDTDYRGRTANGNSLRSTLIRFMTSKGLRKDAVGFRQLNEEEIRAIEAGTANHIYMERFKIYPRIYEVIWEIDRYRLGGDPNGRSLIQRYLYLKAGIEIAREHLWFGVGNGDVKEVYHSYYERISSPLHERLRKMAHNQFLTFLVSFGIPGLLISLLALAGPLFLAGRQHSFLALGFMILVLISMLSEDTLVTARGTAFFAFFFSLFHFGPDFPWIGGNGSMDHGDTAG